jgi:hypothetical protein
MFALALLGVLAGTENGVRCTFENWTMTCMPPTFGSRKSVSVRPTVASCTLWLADCEFAMPKPMLVVPFASNAVFWLACAMLYYP